METSQSIMNQWITSALAKKPRPLQDRSISISSSSSKPRKDLDKSRSYTPPSINPVTMGIPQKQVETMPKKMVTMKSLESSKGKVIRQTLKDQKRERQCLTHSGKGLRQLKLPFKKI